MTYCDKSVLAPYCDNPKCEKCNEAKNNLNKSMDKKQEEQKSRRQAWNEGVRSLAEWDEKHSKPDILKEISIDTSKCKNKKSSTDILDELRYGKPLKRLKKVIKKAIHASNEEQKKIFEEETKARKLAEELLGEIEYGDSRDKPEWRESVIKSATNIISVELQSEYERGNADKLKVMGVSKWAEIGKKFGYWDYFAQSEYERGKAEPHGTMEGYCCACEYDRAVFHEKIREACQEERKRIAEWAEKNKYKNNVISFLEEGHNQALDDLLNFLKD